MGIWGSSSFEHAITTGDDVDDREGADPADLGGGHGGCLGTVAIDLDALTFDGADNDVVERLKGSQFQLLQRAGQVVLKYLL